MASCFDKIRSSVNPFKIVFTVKGYYFEVKLQMWNCKCSRRYFCAGIIYLFFLFARFFYRLHNGFCTKKISFFAVLAVFMNTVVHHTMVLESQTYPDGVFFAFTFKIIYTLRNLYTEKCGGLADRLNNWLILALRTAISTL